MKLEGVRIGKSAPIDAKSGRSGIFKQAQAGRVRIGALGLEGDTIVDVAHHGGADQAVYLVGTEDYAWWSRELGREVAPGTFGENLTVGGLDSAGLVLGDRFRIGAVLLEVTSPRIPCVTLAARMGDKGFVKRFLDASNPGAYARVLQTGAVAESDPVELIAYRGDRIGIVEIMHAWRDGGMRPELRERVRNTPAHYKMCEEI